MKRGAVLFDTHVLHGELRPDWTASNPANYPTETRRAFGEWWRRCDVLVVSSWIQREAADKGFGDVLKNQIIEVIQKVRPDKILPHVAVSKREIEDFQQTYSWAADVDEDEHLFVAAEKASRGHRVKIVSNDKHVRKAQRFVSEISEHIQVVTGPEYVAERDDFETKLEGPPPHQQGPGLVRPSS